MQYQMLPLRHFPFLECLLTTTSTRTSNSLNYERIPPYMYFKAGGSLFVENKKKAAVDATFSRLAFCTPGNETVCSWPYVVPDKPIACHFHYKYTCDEYAPSQL